MYLEPDYRSYLSSQVSRARLQSGSLKANKHRASNGFSTIDFTPRNTFDLQNLLGHPSWQNAHLANTLETGSMLASFTSQMYHCWPPSQARCTIVGLLHKPDVPLLASFTSPTYHCWVRWQCFGTHVGHRGRDTCAPRRLGKG